MSEKPPITNTLSPEKKRDYDFFKSENIKDIISFTKNTIEFLEGLGESNIMFFDRSARLAYVAIDEYWNLKHGTDGLPKPNFYFINPDGIKLKRLGSKNLFHEHVLEEIDEQLSHLDKEKPLVLVDVCIHNGRTMGNVLEYFKEAGFLNIKIVIANTKSNHSDIKSEIPGIKNDTCYIFLHPHRTGDLINSNDYSIFSERNEDYSDQEDARASRKELRQIIRDNYKK